MTYKVNLTDRALRDLAEIYAYIQADVSDQAFQWFNRLTETIVSLEQHPKPRAVPPEGQTLRQLHFGKKPNVYRVIYEMDDLAQIVTVLHIRHGARGVFGPDELV